MFVSSSCLAPSQLPTQKEDTDQHLLVQNKLLAEFLSLSVLRKKNAIWPTACEGSLFSCALLEPVEIFVVLSDYHGAFTSLILVRCLRLWFAFFILKYSEFSAYVYSYPSLVGFWGSQDIWDMCVGIHVFPCAASYMVQVTSFTVLGDMVAYTLGDSSL